LCEVSWTTCLCSHYQIPNSSVCAIIMDGRSRYRFDIVLGLEPGELVRERVTLRAQRRGALLLRERLGSRRLEQLLQILRVGREASRLLRRVGRNRVLLALRLLELSERRVELLLARLAHLDLHLGVRELLT